MRRLLQVLVVLLIFAVIGMLAISLFQEVRGVGIFDQEIILDADQPIRRVTYCSWWIDEDLRREVERTADPRRFECEEAKPLSGEGSEDRFLARILFTTRDKFFLQTQTFYPPQLVVYVEFADGSRACRVADVPPGKGKEAVRIEFRKPLASKC
jgi:hypothetical protein